MVGSKVHAAKRRLTHKIIQYRVPQYSMEWSRMQPYTDKAFELTCR
jgi:hypothetical protein